MKARYAFAIVAMAGLGLGLTGVKQLHAQSKGPAFLVIDYNESNDSAEYKAALNKATGLVNSGGGHFIIRGTNAIALDGAAPKRFVVIEFDSVDKAKAWNSDPAVKDFNAIREKMTKSRSFIVESAPN
jgi:uncharacterized protein (DUF1330 family)